VSKSSISENTYEADLRLLQIELVKLQRHLADKGKRLLVKKFIGYKETLYEFNTQWVKIEQPLESSKTFHLSQSSLRVELGQFIRREQQMALISSVRVHLG
jgi:uncharacterized membrane protein